MGRLLCFEENSSALVIDDRPAEADPCLMATIDITHRGAHGGAAHPAPTFFDLIVAQSSSSLIRGRYDTVDLTRLRNALRAFTSR